MNNAMKTQLHAYFDTVIDKVKAMLDVAKQSHNDELAEKYEQTLKVMNYTCREFFNLIHVTH